MAEKVSSGGWVNFYVRTRERDNVKDRLEALQQETRLTLGELLVALIENEEVERRIPRLVGAENQSGFTLEKRVAAIERLLERMEFGRDKSGEWQNMEGLQKQSSDKEQSTAEEDRPIDKLEQNIEKPPQEKTLVERVTEMMIATS